MDHEHRLAEIAQNGKPNSLAGLQNVDANGLDVVNYHYY